MGAKFNILWILSTSAWNNTNNEAPTDPVWHNWFIFNFLMDINSLWLELREIRCVRQLLLTFSLLSALTPLVAASRCVSGFLTCLWKDDFWYFQVETRGGETHKTEWKINLVDEKMKNVLAAFFSSGSKSLKCF